MTNAERLEVYDKLRDAHKIVYEAWHLHKESIEPFEDTALDAVSGVLYLAEGVFSRQE